MEIKLVNVSKYYYGDGNFAKGLEGINLSFQTDGSFCVVTGESGAGKSTLIRILTGIEEFDEGEIYFDGQPLTGLSESQRQSLYSANVSFVFQDYNLVESLSAIDNIVLALLKRGLSAKEAKSEAKKALEEVGLGKQAKKKASKLSGGERQRVAIARSLALKTKIIIFDEPTGNLDPNTGVEIIEAINRLKENRLIVYVTHDYPLVEKYATRHIVLSDNHIESDTILKESGQETEPMVVDEPKMKASSYFYAGKAFTFSRLSRLVSTCLVLLSGALFAFGVASLATMAFVSTDITGNFVDMGHPTYISFPCGNLAQVKKETTTDEEPYLSYFKEGDLLRDNGGVLLYQDFYLFNTYYYDGAFGNLSANPIRSAYQNALGKNTLFRIGNLLPEGAELYSQALNADGSPLVVPIGYASASLVCYDSGSFPTSALGSSIRQSHYLSPLGNWATLMIPNSFLSSVPTERLSEAGQEYLLSAPKVFIRDVYLTKDASFQGEAPRIIMNMDDMKKVRDYIAEGILLDSSFRLASEVQPMKFGHSLAKEFVDGAPTMFAEEKEYPVSISSAYGEISFPKALEGHLDSAYFSSAGIKIPFSDFVSKTSLEVTYYEGANRYNQFGKLISVSGEHFKQYLIENGGFDAYYGKDAASARELVAKASSGNAQAIYFSSEKTTRELYEVVDFSKLPLWYRVAAIGVIFAASLLMMLLGLILRNILARYYFRQAGDQNVLTWIGYGNKDMLIVNLLPSLFIELAAIALVYSLGLTLIKAFGIMFSLFPYFYFLSFFAALLFAFITSLPLKKKGGVRHD